MKRIKHLVVAAAASLALVGGLAFEPVTIQPPSNVQSCPAQIADGEACNCTFWWCPHCAV